MLPGGKRGLHILSLAGNRRRGYSDQTIIDDYMETKDNLMGFLLSYASEHPEVDIHTIVPNEKNIKTVLEYIRC